MSIQELVEKFLVELARNDFGSVLFPPRRFISFMMKADVTKLARIGEDERALLLVQHEMIVFTRSKIARFDVRFAGHAEMNAEPVVAGKFEQHLFSAPCRS